MKKVLQLVSDDFEDLERWCPVMRLREAGAQVDLVAEKPGKYHGKYGVPCEVELSFNDVETKDYDGILIPGGWAPDKLRRFPKVLQLRTASSSARSAMRAGFSPPLKSWKERKLPAPRASKTTCAMPAPSGWTKPVL